jgi:hypothetical protein
MSNAETLIARLADMRHNPRGGHRGDGLLEIDTEILRLRRTLSATTLRRLAREIEAGVEMLAAVHDLSPARIEGVARRLAA